MDASAVVIADPEGVIRLWSPGAEAAFGHSAQAAMGQSLDLIVPPEFRAAHWNGFRRAVESGHAGVEGQATPFPVVRADGRVAATPGVLTLLRQPGGQVAALMVVFDAAGC
jgi:PAS domain S-box-containing protein